MLHCAAIHHSSSSYRLEQPAISSDPCMVFANLPVVYCNVLLASERQYSASANARSYGIQQYHVTPSCLTAHVVQEWFKAIGVDKQQDSLAHACRNLSPSSGICFMMSGEVKMGSKYCQVAWQASQLSTTSCSLFSVSSHSSASFSRGPMKGDALMD